MVGNIWDQAACANGDLQQLFGGQKSAANSKLIDFSSKRSRFIGSTLSIFSLKIVSFDHL